MFLLLGSAAMVCPLTPLRAQTSQSAAGIVAAPTTRPFPAIDAPHLQNLHRINEKLLSGAQPEGEEGFEELAALGVKTIISVDGAAPDLVNAKKYGMRYVHLPFGYDTVPPEQGVAIAKAIDELAGPIYVHCHHGKHRSAAAVAVACVMNGMIPPDQAEAVLKTFGTGANYDGLWQSAREARPMEPEKLQAVKVSYVEKAPIPPLAEAMVHVDDRSEHLKLIKAARWQKPADHPDLDPAHEALQLQELLTEIGRIETVANRPADFRRMLASSAEDAGKLSELLRAPMRDLPAIEAVHERLSASCTACHATFRD
jgi:protein tyrosine phosphatase (PTP) superfamily phosphohydrolase (DUF442 family)